MKQRTHVWASGLTLVVLLAAGCAAPQHRMNVAADRDDDRRARFEECRANGHSDCDAILNAPVNSHETSGDAVREHERREAYDRCVAGGGNDCSDLLRR